MYMYVLHNNEAQNALRAIAMLVVVALMMWVVGVIPFSQKAAASNVTSFSDTLSDSDMNMLSNHTFRFTTPSGLTSGQTLSLTFPAGFILATNTATGLDFNDMDVTDDGVEITLADSPAGASTWGVSTTTNSITFTTGSAGISSSSAIVIEIGTNATSGATGDTQIRNPFPGVSTSYQIDLGGNGVDTGHTRVAILDDVDVTAAVDTTFTFTVTGMSTSSSLNGTSTTRTSTASAIPFGTLTDGVIQTLAQRLNVATNAVQGFVVTVAQSSNLLSSTGADIDGFSNGTYVDTPAPWSDPTNNIANENTWGHWGLTSEDDINTSEFSSDKWISASTTPRAIFSHTGPADGTTNNIGSTTVGYQVEITALQEAADDYTTTLTYVATPTF